MRLLATSPLALALVLTPALAHALCQPMATSGQRETLVTEVSLNDATALLALDGSRIETRLPRVGVATGTRATPFIWAERVDWSVYAAAPDVRIGATVLRYERGADGVRHLCGIAQYRPNDITAAKAASQAAPLPNPDEETRFIYDGAGRLSGYELRSRNGEGRLNPSISYCLRYDRHGWLAELSAAACDKPAKPQTRYVHDAAGRLLRTISYLENQGDAREVRVHDREGNPAERYLRPTLDQNGDTITLGLPYRDTPTNHAVAVLAGANWKAPALDSYHYEWFIVQSKGPGRDQDVYHAKRDPNSVLARGNSGANGQFLLTSAQRQRVWDAAGQSPGGVQWLWAPGQIFTLLQALPDATWAACTDPLNLNVQACGKR